MSSVELFKRLREPFQSSDLEWRVMRSGMKRDQSGPWAIVVPYVDRAALINRLNQVCGLGGWQSDTRMADGHVSVGVAILVDDRWVWRYDGTGHLQPDEPHFSLADAGKGDFSMAFKRACEQFGIATYLREIGDLFAIWNDNGRYRAKVAGEWKRWDPPGLDGSPSYPGTIPDAPKGTNGSSSQGQEENRKPPPKPKELTDDEKKARIQEAKDRVREYMNQSGYKRYHLDAVVQVHPKLKDRYASGEDLGRLGTLEDWLIVEELTRRNRSMWDDAPKTLAKDFPTGPPRLQALEELLDKVKLDGKELVEVQTAKNVGWNDGIEYWIEELGKR